MEATTEKSKSPSPPAPLPKGEGSSNLKPTTNPNDNLSKWRFVNLAFELGFIIALPLVAFALIGKWADAKFGTDPWLTLAGIVFAIVITTVWLTRRFKEMIK